MMGSGVDGQAENDTNTIKSLSNNIHYLVIPTPRRAQIYTVMLGIQISPASLEAGNIVHQDNLQRSHSSSLAQVQLPTA